TWAVVGNAGDVQQEGRDREDLSVFGCPPVQVRVLEDHVEVVTDRVTVRVALEPPALTWSLPSGERLLGDHPDLAYRHATPRTVVPEAQSQDTRRTAAPRGIRHTLTRDLDEIYLGLGEVSGALDKHHRRYRLSPKDALGYDAQFSDPLYKHMPVYTTL